MIQSRFRFVAYRIAAILRNVEQLSVGRLAISVEHLVDPASSYMIVSKIKQCMCVHKLLHSEPANESITRLLTKCASFATWPSAVILELIHDHTPAVQNGCHY